MIPLWFSILLATTTAHSLTTDKKSENPPIVVCSNQTDHEMNNLRQQLNQETTIRLSLTRQIYSMVDDMITMKKQMAKMECIVQEMEKKEDDLQHANQQLQKELNQYMNMSNSFDETSAQFGKLQKDLLNITSAMDTFCNGTYTDALLNRSVAFEASLADNRNSFTGRVVFGKVVLNSGNGYDNATGIFTATKTGIYVFEWTTVVWIGKASYTLLNAGGE